VIFRDLESGAKTRPRWEELKEAAKRGEVGAVVVWALDRAGRDPVRLVVDLAELAHARVQIVSVRETWLDQPPGPMLDLLIKIFSWFAGWERERNRERTRAALQTARDKGVKLGRPRVEVDVAKARAILKETATARRIGVARGTLVAALGLGQAA
jgi:DNA invertase Pin-like site-specific DNA recombinase